MNLNAFGETSILAHELAHALLDHAPYRLQEHSKKQNNVLLDGLLESMTTKDPTFSMQQLEFIRRSPLLLAC